MSQGYYIDALRHHFDATVAVAGETCSHLMLAGHRVEIRWAGNDLRERFLPALRHLETHAPAAIHADLVMHAWVQRDGIPPATPPPWNTGEAFRHGEVQGLGAHDGTVIYESGLSLVHAIKDGEAFFHARVSSTVPKWEDAAPFRVIFNRWFSERGGHVVHGAGLAQNGHCLLLAGPGGSGKSTTALRWLAAGGGYLADDYCLIIRSDHACHLHSLYNTAKVVAEDVSSAHAKNLTFSLPGPRNGEKPATHLWPRHAGQLTASAKLQAIILPAVVDQAHTRLCQARGSATWAAVVKPTIQQIHGCGRTSLEFLMQIAVRVPTWRLELGHDSATAALPLLQELLASSACIQSHA